MRIFHRVLRKLSPLKVAKTYFGASIPVDLHDFIQATIFYFGVWEPHLSASVDRLVLRNDIAVDVGANIGYFSLLLATRVGPEGKVIAIEAHPALAALVKNNAQRNAHANVSVRNYAAASEPGDLELFEGPASNVGATSTKANRDLGRKIQVPALPLMEILDGEDLFRITFIKIDIEGAEGPVVRDLLANHAKFSRRLAVAVEINLTDVPDWPSLFKQFLGLGFRAYSLNSDYRWEHYRASARSPIRQIWSLEGDSLDVIFVRDA